MPKKKQVKTLWKGIFNYPREIIILYTYAFSPLHAREIFFRRLATMHGVEVCRVRQLFSGGKSNYKIKIETEFTEVDDE